jgi:hypothetical protein
MELNEGKRYLNVLLDHVFDLLYVHCFGVNHAEHVFVQIWKLLANENDNLKSWFFEQVRKNLLCDDKDVTKIKVRPEGFIDDDLICFLAHATKWDEFKDIAEERASKLNELKTLNDTHDISIRLLEALKDEWEDRDFYYSFDNQTIKWAN